MLTKINKWIWKDRLKRYFENSEAIENNGVTQMSANKEYGARCFAYGYVFAGGNTANLQRILVNVFDKDKEEAAQCAAAAVEHLARLLMGEDEQEWIR